MPNEHHHPEMPLPVIIASASATVLALLHLFVPAITIDTVGLALLLVAILPWIMPYVQRSIKTIDILGNRVEFLETEVNKQQRLIHDLVIFSISASLVDMLSHLYHRQEYTYHANEGFQRNLRFLRNHGYIHYFRFDALHDGQDLVGTLRLTPAGELLVQERERREMQYRT
jgi:hypothetical protein